MTENKNIMKFTIKMINIIYWINMIFIVYNVIQNPSFISMNIWMFTMFLYVYIKQTYYNIKQEPEILEDLY